MPSVTYSAEKYSDIVTINRDRIDSYVMYGLVGGLSTYQWNAEIFVNNVTDERAEIARSFTFDRERVTYARPLTAGVRLSYDF